MRRWDEPWIAKSLCLLFLPLLVLSSLKMLQYSCHVHVVSFSMHNVYFTMYIWSRLTVSSWFYMNRIDSFISLQLIPNCHFFSFDVFFFNFFPHFFMMKKSFLQSILVVLIFTECGFGWPKKYYTGNEDPPTCDGKPRQNPFPGQCGRRLQNNRRWKRWGGIMEESM